MTAKRAKDAWAAFFDDAVVRVGLNGRPAVFGTKADAKAWAKDTIFRIARVRITEITQENDDDR